MGSWLTAAESDANLGVSAAASEARLESSLIQLAQNENTQQDGACFGKASRCVTGSWQEAALVSADTEAIEKPER